MNSKEKTVLLLDTAFAALPIYEYLVSTGCKVWVMGNRPLDVLAVKAGNLWIDADYSDPYAVQEWLTKLDIQYVVPGCTDLSIDTCVRLRGDTSFFDSIEVNEILANKALFRNLCKRLKLPSPQTFKINEFPRAGQYIAKPVDAFSGKGISTFDGNNLKDAEEAYKFALSHSRSDKVIIENLIIGQLYSYSAFVENHSVTAAFVVKEGSSYDPYAVDTSYVVSNPSEMVTQILRDSIELICSDLKLSDGLVHVQYILGDDGPILIELCRRCPGDLYSLLIFHSTGFDYGAKYASYFLDTSLECNVSEFKFILRHTLNLPESEVLQGITFEHKQKLLGIYPLQTLGYTKEPTRLPRVALLFFEYNDHTELLDGYKEILDKKLYANK